MFHVPGVLVGMYTAFKQLHAGLISLRGYCRSSSPAFLRFVFIDEAE